MIHTTPRDNIPFVRLVVIDIVSEGLEMRHSKDGGKVWKKFSVVLTTCLRVANLVVYVNFRKF